MVTQRIDIKDSCRSIFLIFREFNPFAVILTVFWGEMHLYFSFGSPSSLSFTVFAWVAIVLFPLETKTNTDRLTQTTLFVNNLDDEVY